MSLESPAQAKVVTSEYLKSRISKVTYYYHGLLTICVLDIVNGFTVIGKSGCVYPEKYDINIGERLAFEDARNNLWSLEGYLAADQRTKILAQEAADKEDLARVSAATQPAANATDAQQPPATAAS